MVLIELKPKAPRMPRFWGRFSFWKARPKRDLMEIKIPAVNPGFFKRVDPKEEQKDSSEFEQHLKDEHKKQKRQADDDSEPEVTEEAIETASVDLKSLGVATEVIADAKSPGLRVDLKDAKGKLIRQLSGEEFLKLRSAVDTTTKTGRILDEKA